MVNKSRVLAFTFFMLVLPPYSQGQVINRCVDDSGNITFSDSPCALGESRSTAILNPNANVMDGSKERELAAPQAPGPSGPPPASSGQASYDPAHQRELAEQKRKADEFLAEAQRARRRSEIATRDIQRSGHIQHAKSLRESAEILTSATEVSYRGVEILENANRSAWRAIHARNRQEFRNLVSEARDMREIARKELGAPVTASEQRRRTATTNPPIHDNRRVRPQPSVITSCDRNGCWDDVGNRYNSGAGNTFFRDDGQTCQRIGNMIQCH